MKLIQKIIINVLMTVSIFLLGMFSLHSQSFKLVYDANDIQGSKMFSQYNGNLTHFPSKEYIIIDKNDNKQVYSAFSTGIDDTDE
jgi:hypothetical protein